MSLGTSAVIETVPMIEPVMMNMTSDCHQQQNFDKVDLFHGDFQRDLEKPDANFTLDDEMREVVQEQLDADIQVQ